MSRVLSNTERLMMCKHTEKRWVQTSEPRQSKVLGGIECASKLVEMTGMMLWYTNAKESTGSVFGMAATLAFSRASGSTPGVAVYRSPCIRKPSEIDAGKLQSTNISPYL